MKIVGNELQRLSKRDFYLSVAQIINKRGTCQRRRWGAVIVRDDQIVSTGYVGAPRNAKNCLELDLCPRIKAGIKSGEKYELCRSVHAEMNAVINAARAGVSILDGTMYLVGENTDDSPAETGVCPMCQRVIINAGLKEVILMNNQGVQKINVADWIDEQ